MKHCLVPLFIALSLLFGFVSMVSAAAQNVASPHPVTWSAYQTNSVVTASLTLPALADLPPDTWQIDGSDLVLFYVRDDTLFRFDLAQQVAHPIAQAEVNMQLRDDGAYMAYADKAGVQLLDTQTGETSLLLPHIQIRTAPPEITDLVFPYSWSSASDDLLVTIQEQLSICPDLGWLSLTEKTLHPLLPQADCVGTAAWSPTGRRIAASGPDGGHGGYPGFGVRVFDLSDSSQQLMVERELEPGVLATAAHIAWSPDEAWLAFSLEHEERSRSDPKLRLYLSRPDGRELQALTHNSRGQADFPVWATSNTLFYALNKADTGADGLYRYNLVDQSHTLVLPGQELQPLNLSPDGEFILYRDDEALKLWATQADNVIPVTDEAATFVGWLAGPEAQPVWQPRAVAGQRLTALAIDSQGQPWFGTSGGTDISQGNVIHGEGRRQRVYTTADGLVRSNRVTAITYDNAEKLWFGTDQGVSTFDGQNWRSYTTSDGLVSNAVTAIASDADGVIWFGTDQGVSTFDGQNWRSYTTTHGLVNKAVTAIAIDAQDHKWIGTDQGVSTFDGQAWRSYTTTHGLAFPGVNAIAVDGQGDKWFATPGGGISQFDGSSWTTYTAADGLASNVVYDLAVDQAGVVWAGTSGGVSQFDGVTWTTYTTEDGLLDNPVSIVDIDPAGHKWFGYRRGTNFSQWDSRRWVTKFDDSRGQSPSVTMPVEITAPLTMPLSALTVTPPFLIDEPADRMYVRASGADSQPTFVLVLTLDGQPLTTYNLTGEMALDEDNGWLYVDQPDNQGLMVINTRTDRLHTIIALPEEIENSFYSQPPSPPPLAEPTTNRVIAVRDNVVYIADPESGAVVETIAFDFAMANSSEKITDIHHTQYDPSTGILYLTFITYNCTSAMGGDCDGYTTVSYDLGNKREIARKQGDRPGQALAGYLHTGYFTCIGPTCNGQRSIWREGRPWLESSGWQDDDGYRVFDAVKQQIYEISPVYVRIYEAQTMTLLWHIARPDDGLFVDYQPQTDSLRFWDQGQIRSWSIRPPSPEPLRPSSPPTTSIRSMVVSPDWPTDRTIIGTWDNPYDGASAPISQERPTPRECNYPPRLYFTRDEGQSWAESTGGLVGSCGLTFITFSPGYADDQTMLGSVPGLGLVKSTDGGQLWQPSGAGIVANRVDQILFSSGFSHDQTIFVRADTWYRSSDGGQQWEPLSLPEAAADSADLHQPSLILSPEFDKDQTLLVTIETLEQDELYISRDGGKQWTIVGDLPVEAHAVWVAPLFEQWQTLFASGKQDDQGVLYRSTDGGATWQVVLTGSAAVHDLVFAPDIEQDRPMFARAGSTLYHSTDGGETWQVFAPATGITPTALAISPTFSQDRTLFIGTDHGNGHIESMKAAVQN